MTRPQDEKSIEIEIVNKHSFITEFDNILVGHILLPSYSTVAASFI
jgi:hypothetical protein